MSVDWKWAAALALGAAVSGCVAPEEKPPPSRPVAAAPATPPPANLEAAPVPNRALRPTSSSVITVDQGKSRQ